jgi:hypothetical protein
MRTKDIPQGKRIVYFSVQKNQMCAQQPFQQVPSAQCRSILVTGKKHFQTKPLNSTQRP